MKRPPLRYSLTIGVLLIMCLVWLCWPVNPFNFDTVAKVHAGQTYPEVISILGPPRHTYAPEGSVGHLVCRWGPNTDDHAPLGTPFIVVTFRNGVVSEVSSAFIQL